MKPAQPMENDFATLSAEPKKRFDQVRSLLPYISIFIVGLNDQKKLFLSS